MENSPTSGKKRPAK